MKTKKFLGLPVIQSAGLYAMIRNYLSVILFAGIGYFLIAMLLGSFAGDTWKFIQSSEHYYLAQAILLVFGIILGHLSRIFANKKLGDRFFIWKKFVTDNFVPKPPSTTDNKFYAMLNGAWVNITSKLNP